ncbi:MAG: Stp1/IreP family PP2C-type Ser/Thr phosphatase [Myxococcales bacterium]|nr:Stp1/IreP family PP2C-type Ser/Thr phosphatase [Myxococcales bacterium]MDD9965064.1 Stp1/IreP family PP2C-type Ser/Thr phosphatase [Myxococcales bacterium]
MAATPQVIAAGKTDVGRKRTHNEDNFALVNEEHLFLVADGMGGHSSGEVASGMAIETMSEFFKATSADPDATWPYKMDKTRGYEENRLVTGIKLANRRIYEASQRENRLHGMGTTIVSLLCVQNQCLIGHVGDSRVYRLRGEVLEQLTEDHSLLNDYIKMKSMSQEEIENFPHKNVIVRALGMKESVKVDALLDMPQPGDTYILCSDGLAGPISDEEIRALALEHQNLEAAAGAMIERANENGGPDNITVVLCRWLGTS